MEKFAAHKQLKCYGMDLLIYTGNEGYLLAVYSLIYHQRYYKMLLADLIGMFSSMSFGEAFGDNNIFGIENFFYFNR